MLYFCGGRKKGSVRMRDEAMSEAKAETREAGKERGGPGVGH